MRKPLTVFGLCLVFSIGSVALAHAYSAPDQPLIPPPHRTAPISAVPRFGKFEAAFTLPHQTGNPFDPEVNDVDVTFFGTGVSPVRVPAFWDGDCWKVRFAPTHVGKYKLTIARNGVAVHPLRLTSNAFRCTPSSDPGFIHRDPREAQRFMFDNGRGYYPLGVNQAWTAKGYADYPGMFAKMHRAGLNWARVWMTFWDDKALDWAANPADNPRIGYYYLPAARRWDMVIDEAERNGIYVQMTLQHHGQYTSMTDPNWAQNPFNISNGGFLNRPEAFFTNPAAKKLTRAKYRYIVARWGYSTHLFAFELFNEVQNIREMSGHWDTVALWHRAMAASVRSEDVDHHLITTSMSYGPDNALSNIGMDFDQAHVYTNSPRSVLPGIGGPITAFVGESGPNDFSYNVNAMNADIVRQGLWAGLTAPASGAAQFWYWDFLDHRNWWPMFASAAAFYRSSGAADETNLRAIPGHVAGSGPMRDLTFTFADAWMDTTSSVVPLVYRGDAQNTGQVSSYIQGSNHREMMPRPVEFRLDAPTACTFRVEIGNAARAGAHARLLLDGRPVADIAYAPAASDRNVSDSLSASVPAGPHALVLENIGPDWYRVGSITVTKYTNAPPFDISMKANRHFALFYVYARDKAAASEPASLVAAQLTPGLYRVSLWSPISGKQLVTRSMRIGTGPASIVLPAGSAEIAGYVKPAAR